MNISFDHVFDFCEEIGQKSILTPAQRDDLATIKGFDAVPVEIFGKHDGEFFQSAGLDAGLNVEHWLMEIRNHVAGISEHQVLSIHFLMINVYNRFVWSMDGQDIARREYFETINAHGE